MDKKAVDFRKTGRYKQIKKKMEEKGDDFFKWVRLRKETEKAYYLDTKSYDDYRRQFWIPKNWYNKEKEAFTKAGKIEYIIERLKKENYHKREEEQLLKEIYGDGAETASKRQKLLKEHMKYHRKDNH